MMKIEEPDFKLPYNENKQLAVLGHLLQDESFFAQGASRIEPGWFSSFWAAKVWEAARSFFEKYERMPTVEEIKCTDTWSGESSSAQAKMNDAILISELEKKKYGLDVIKSELTSWLKCNIYRKWMALSQSLYNGKKFDEAVGVLNNGISDFYEANFEGSNRVMFYDYKEYLKQESVDLQNALTFGISSMDHLLIGIEEPTSPISGGMIRGETTLLVGPLNAGKTSVMINVCAANILKGKKVLYIAHEGRTNDIRQKILERMLGVSRHQLLELYKTEVGDKLLQSAVSLLDKNMFFEDMPGYSLTVEEVAAVIESKQQVLKTKNNGNGFDLVVDDYPGKLTSTIAGRMKMEKRHVDHAVYDCFVHLGKKHNFHVLVAVQTNREGYRQNMERDDGDKPFLSAHNIAEAFGIPQIVDNVISINRNPNEAHKNYVTYYISKSRGGNTGYAVVCKTDFSKCITHSEELGSIWYIGNRSDGEKIEEYLKALKPGVSTGVSSL
jgi:KaiC/GvpD/RAD55 family RecA-like ATPase